MQRLTGLLALGTCMMLTGCFDEDKLSGVPLKLELTARKDYRPSRWTDGLHSFDKDTRFQVPARLDVVFGNSGNHKSYLFFKKAKDKKESRCEYQGGSSQSHPKGEKELDKAKVYKLVKCDGGLKADDVAVAKDLRLRLDHGGNDKESAYTIIKATVLYAGTAPTPTPTVVVTPVVTPTPVITSTPTPLPTPDIFIGLPPDPGEAGKATLQGIDADNDGVRDDIQRWARQRFQGKPDLERLAKRSMRAAAKVIPLMNNREAAIQAMHAYLKDLQCLSWQAEQIGVPDEEITDFKMDLFKLRANTKARVLQDLEEDRIFSGQSISSEAPSFYSTFCRGD
jgi:hypothetical protein